MSQKDLIENQIPTEKDFSFVARSLDREPKGRFTVSVRDEVGNPRVIRNYPLLPDGSPMPTLYWLVDPKVRSKIGFLESHGGVKQAESECDESDLAKAHLRYSQERDSEIPTAHMGPKPSGGVGGTRQGVKCLHAHYAWFLAGGKDPIGEWVDQKLNEMNKNS